MIARWQRTTLALLAGAMLACAGEQQAAPAPRTGTERMADTGRPYRQAVANPLGNPFLSRERADAIQTKIALQTGPSDFNDRFRMAQERLKAGQTREAIAELKRSCATRASRRTPSRRGTKPVFDLLALAYLRLGEQENCIDNPAANVCILPLEGGGAAHASGGRARRDRAVHGAAALLPRRPRLAVAAQHRVARGRRVSGQRAEAMAHSGPGAARRTTLSALPQHRRRRRLAVTGLAGGAEHRGLQRRRAARHLHHVVGARPVRRTSSSPTGRRLRRPHRRVGARRASRAASTVRADYDNDGDVDISCCAAPGSARRAVPELAAAQPRRRSRSRT